MAQRPLALALALVLSLLALALSAAPPTGPFVRGGEEDLGLPAVPGAVRRPLVAGEYEAALEQLGNLKSSLPEQLDNWLYLEATALSLAGRVDEAIERTEELESGFPESDWLRKARFLRAGLFSRARRHAEAEAIWEAEAKRLLSDGRKRELAAIYLDAADELVVEPDPGDPGAAQPDWGRAYQLYERVRSLDAPRDVEARALFGMARCLEEQAKGGSAAGAFRRYLQLVDPGLGGDALQGDEARAQLFDARLRMGQNELAGGDRAGARRTLEDLLEDLSGAFAGEAPYGPIEREATRTRLTRIDGDSMLALSMTWNRADALELPLAVAALRRFLAAHPGHPETPQAYYDVGEVYRVAGRHEDALLAFAEFLADPMQQVTDEDARVKAAELRQAALYHRGWIQQQQKRYEDAIATYEDYVGRFPTGAHWAAAQQALVDCEFLIGAAKREAREFEAAREEWRAFLERHPLDSRAAQIALDLGWLYVQEADALAEEAGEDTPAVLALFEGAIGQWRRVNGKHPGSSQASEALFRIGGLYEQRLGDLEAAVDAYRKCNFGQRHGDALMRLERMTSPDLALLTERTYRTDEPARVTAQVRNLEELSVELYRLDMEAYFRKHLTHRGVEVLDLDLIAPDRSFELPVEGYAKYAPLEQAIDVEMDGPGVWIVVAESGELRATTLLVRSDVEIVVKSSLRELFVYAEDVRAGEPAGGTSVLVALPGVGEAGATFVEAKTDQDGVARVDLSEQEGVGDVRVLATREGSIAAEGIGLGGLGLARGLTPRGFVFTERPAYQPGQTAHVRAVVRDVVDGAYDFEEGELWALEVADPGGRVVHRRELSLSRFGTLAADVPLDGSAATGEYSVTVRTPGGQPYAGRFLVEPYRLRPVELVLETDEDVYYRGETVAVEAQAAWYYGEPLADAPLRYTLPDGRQGEVRTDAQGLATFEFETRDFLRGGALSFSAALLEEGVQAQGTVYVAVRGFDVEVGVSRDVVLSGEPLEVTVRTRTPGGEPVTKIMNLAVYRRESATGGGWSEVLVAEREIATGPVDGVERATFTLEEGGNHVLRVRGTDRFENPVEGVASVFVSGDADEVKLRFLVDQSRLDVGERATVVLHNRGGAGLALVTFEGETVFAHRVAHLDEGRNELSFEVDHEHFPNFVLAAAAMRGSLLHTAQAEFGVARALNVELVPAADVVRPGEETTVAMRVTDQLGRPVEAELSVGVVDAALFDLYSERHGALAPFFESGARREAALRTTSSCTFHYEGRTTQISAEVLAEALREEASKAWEQRKGELRSALSLVDREIEGMPAASSQDFFLGAGVALAQPSPSGPSTPGPEEAWNDVIGIGGGAGGQFGSRRGGRRNLRAGAGMAGEDAPSRAAETAFWAPAVITDADGRAEVTFRMPARSTRWRVAVHGVTPDTILGESKTELVTRADFSVELKAPGVLTEGDRPQLVARVHNLTGHAGEVTLRLRVTGTDRPVSLPATVTVPAEGVVEHVFPALDSLPLVESLSIELAAEGELGGETHSDEWAEALALRPWGLEVADAASGSLAGDRTVWLELPGGGPHRGRSLELYLGPGVRSLLLDEALGRVPGDVLRSIRTRDDAAADLFGLCAVIEYLRDAGLSEQPELSRLLERAGGRVAHLVATQRSDGGWSWSGSNQTDPGTSALSLAALGRARDVALVVPPDVTAKGVAWAEQAFRSATQSQDERKAMLQWALSAHGRADFGALNRLHRERARLSTAGLAYTALALAAQGNGPMAADVAAGLEEDRAQVTIELAGGGLGCLWRYEDNDAWSRSPVEATALALLALEHALPSSPAIERGVAALLAGRPWQPARGRGLALAAMARHYGVTETRDDAVTVTVLVDGRQVESISLVGGAPGQRVEVPGEALADARVRVDLEVAGRGELVYTAVLRGTSPEVERRDGPGLRVLRHLYLATGPYHAGRELPHGFSVVHGDYERWSNEVRNLELGGVTRAQVDFYQSYNSRDPLESAEYLVLDVPLPAGVTVLEGSISGAYDSVEEREGLLRFHVGLRRGNNTVQYSFVGRSPGAYRALPAVVRSVNRPDRYAVGEPGALDVLGRGEASSDPYRETPDELFHLGKALYGDGEEARAWDLLSRLYDEWEANLDEGPLRETAEMLLFLAIDRGGAQEIVRYFEVLKERNPGLVVPFEKVLAVGEAYRRMEEHERATLVFRATIEETFGKDLKVAGALEEQGTFLHAIGTLEDLWLEFPDTPAVRAAYLTSADKLLTKAKVAHQDAALKAAGIDRADLELAGIAVLQRFLALYPTDPTAPDAGLNLVSAFLELEDYETASAEAGRFATRFTEPRYSDAFLYTQAVADWYQGLDDEARERLQRIAEAEYVGEDGVRRPSINRELSFYILGQIHHARREPEAAITYYEKVADQFPDAREAIAGFRERVLSLEEVTVARPGEPVELEIEHRNLEQADLLVYAVDLMTLYLREKDLSRVTGVDLAGIAPVLRETIGLEGGGALRSAESKVALALEEPGAYLVIARGGELHTSGLVLVSPLELEVREDPVAARLRVQVLDHASGEYLRGVDVRVVGSASGSITSGETDPRGLYVADAVMGVATVIARHGDDTYAFYRGETALGGVADARRPQQDAEDQAFYRLDEKSFLHNVLDLNEAQQQGRFKSYQEELERSRKGVQVQQVQ